MSSTSAELRGQTVGSLALRLASESASLLGDTARLLSAEARERVVELRPALGLLSAAVGALLLFLTAAGAAAVVGLALVMPLWAAALVVAAIALGVSVACASAAFGRLRRLARPPEQTLGALKEGMEWLRLRTRA
jgi:Putative Actinobacterial Holin-X, holin superfamily III